MPPKYHFIEKDTELTHQTGSSNYMPIGAKSFISLFFKWIVLQFQLISAADVKYCNFCEKEYRNSSKINSDHVVGAHMWLDINGKF